MIMFWLTAGFSVFYFLMLMVMAFAFGYEDSYENVNSEFSILIATRNEEDNIERILRSLAKQKKKPFAIIVIDDHSEDNTVSKAKSFLVNHPELNIKVLESPYTGKKGAFKKACEISETELILSVDADCYVNRYWTEYMLSQVNEQSRIIGAPVLYDNSKVALSMFFRSELLNLVATGIAASRMNLPYQVSGAGMLFYKSDYLDFTESDYGKSCNHGDDVFFMQYIIHKYGSRAVSMVNHRFSVVMTKPPKNLIEFIRQRVRWASKARSYRSITPFIFGFIAVLKNLFLPLSVVLFICSGMSIFLLPVGIIFLADYFFSAVAAIRMRYRYSLLGQLLLFVFYPLLMLWIAFALPFSGRNRWKGRLV